MPVFEVLMISIDWEGANRIRTITPSKKSLKPSAVRGTSYEYDIIMYTAEDGLYYQFAIKTKYTPFLKTNQGKWSRDNQLFNIKDDLWIIKGDWKTGRRGASYHHCPSINTAGKIEIGISEDLEKLQHFITIDINSSIDDFDFEQLKSDFEGELWNLITSNKSVVSSDRVELRYNDKLYRFPENKSIVEFIKAFDKISKNPKRELATTQTIRRAEKVIPITETYRKLSILGSATHLPSKSAKENNDIFENRFICYMLHSIHVIVSKNIKYTSLHIKRLSKEVEVLNEKITILQDPDPRLDPVKVFQEIQAQEEFYAEWLRRWELQKNVFVNNYPSEGQTYQNTIIEILYRAGINSYWVNLQNNQGNNEYCLFVFSRNCDEIFEEQKGINVSISASFNHIGQAGNFNKYHVNAINQISLNSNSYVHIIRKQQQNYNTLKNNDWKQFSILSPSEKNKLIKEKNNQIQTLARRIEKINLQIQTITSFLEEQSALFPLIEQRLKTSFVNGIKYKKIQGFKPSMTFIQNAAYRNAHYCYKDILKSEGIDIEVFDLYENVTTYGIREMPQVYELWCLVTIIKVLDESFHFAHHATDITSLLKCIDPKKNAIEGYSRIGFKSHLAGRQITLHYQQRLSNDKRPDFVLEITSNTRTIKLVLDAKFKNYNYKQTIVYETLAMLEKYRGDDNYVFVLHPCKDGLFQDRSIKYTNHGGERIFYGAGESQTTKFPFHEYGYIELKPNFTDSLKKLIGMAFEYLLEPSRNAKQSNRSIDPKPTLEMFCLNCGGTDISISMLTRGNNRHFYNCTCNDQNCGHEIHIDYCWNCKTRLFKHGSYWDYHLESAWSTFDIRCPSCGMTLADRPQHTEF